jgi:hypothetical protein
MDEKQLAKVTWRITGGPTAKDCKVISPTGEDVTGQIVAFTVDARAGLVRLSIEALAQIDVQAVGDVPEAEGPKILQMPTPKVVRLN